jgi:hypothetical protein
MHAFVRTLVGESRWKIIAALIDAYPDPVDKAELAVLAETTATSSGYTNNLGSLRSFGLLDYPRQGMVRAEPVLFLEAAP